MFGVKKMVERIGREREKGGTSHEHDPTLGNERWQLGLQRDDGSCSAVIGKHALSLRS